MISSSFSAVVVCVCSEVKYFILLQLVVLLYTLLVAEKLPLKVVLLSRYGTTQAKWRYRRDFTGQFANLDVSQTRNMPFLSVQPP